MKLISHRGNLTGRNIDEENSPSYILNAVLKGYDVEIDLWYLNDLFYLGHDAPQYVISYDWLYALKDKLWVHCKNIESLIELVGTKIHYFWHETDTVALTSNGIIWAYPGTQPIKNSIAVSPEMYFDDISQCSGVCSDEIINYI
jgi:hypothetical protein